MPFWVLLAVQVALTVVSYALRSRARSQIPIQSPDVPDTQSGDPVPVFWGRCKIPLRIVDFREGDWTATAIRRGPRSFLGIVGQRPIVGYEYRVSCIGLIAHGPVEALEDVLIDGRSLLAAGPGRRPVITYGGGSPPTPTVTFTTVTTVFAPNTEYGAMQGTGLASVVFYAPSLLGGENGSAQGGVEGTLYFRNGTGHDTTIAPFLSRRALTPDWRNYAHIYLENCWLGNSPQLPPLHVVCTANARGWQSLFLPGSGDYVGDCAAGAILWDLLTDTEVGLGLPEEMVDRTSFFVLQSPGLSFVLDQTQPVQRVIEDVLRTADATLVTDPVTGKLRAWAVRAKDDPTFGYVDPAALPQITTANAESLTWVPPTPASDTNVISVSYLDRARNARQHTITETHHALVAQAGQTVPLQIDFLGVTNEPLARRLAARELRAQTTPLGRATVRCTRALSNVFPGAWVRVNWAEYGLVNRVMRVVEVDTGTLSDPAMTLSLVDDVYSVPGFAADRIVSEPWEPSRPDAADLPPSVQAQVYESITPTDIPFTLALIDPQTRAVSLEWRAYAANTAAPGWTALWPGAFPLLTGWALSAPRVEGDGTVIEWRLTWTDSAGDTQEIIDGLLAGVGATEMPAPQFQVVWTDATTAQVTIAPSNGTAITAVRVASGTTPPTSGDVAAASLDSTPPFQTTVTVPTGEVRYVAASARGVVGGITLTSGIAQRELARSGGPAGGLTTRFEPVVADISGTVELVLDDTGDILMAEVPI